MKLIHICAPSIEKVGEIVRLSYDIEVDGKNARLYYALPECYSKFLCNEVADGVIVTFLPFAMRGGYDIVSDIPVSERLFFQLTTQLIPQLLRCNKKAHNTLIMCDSIITDYRPTATATAISCGVDSFTTLKEYTIDCPLEDYKITHLTFFENGAHHLNKIGYDERQERVFEGQLAHVRKFCDMYGYELIYIASNLNQVLSELFWNDGFVFTHTYRNIGFTLLLQKLIKTYYYSAAFDLDSFRCSLDDDPAFYEKFLLPCLSTEHTTFYSSNKSMSRLEKTKYISNFEQTYDNLLVCYMSDKNCGKCSKCIRTLLTLDVLGISEKYRHSFDIDYYKQHRNQYFTKLCAGRYINSMMTEIYDYAVAHQIKIPLQCKFFGFFERTWMRIKIRIFPVYKVFRDKMRSRNG